MDELKYLLLTIAVELPIAMACLRKEDVKHIVLTVVGVNMISHPIIWSLLFEYRINWFAGEIGVTAFEAIVFTILFPNHRILAICTAILMNIVTASIGYMM